MNRKLLWSVLVIGLALVVAPFALGMPGKMAAGSGYPRSNNPSRAPHARLELREQWSGTVFRPAPPSCQGAGGPTNEHGS